jgi:hypothetical protein
MAEAMPLHLARIDELLDGVLTPAEEEALASMLRRIRDHIRGLGLSTACEESESGASMVSGAS